MGNEASSENDRQAREHMVSYKQFVRDIQHINKLCAGSFVDGRTGCHLSFEPVTNLTHHELLAVLWRQEGRLLVIVHKVPKAEPSNHNAEHGQDAAVPDGAVHAAAESERKCDAALRAAKCLTVQQFYHLFHYVTLNAPILQQATIKLSNIRHQRQEHKQQDSAPPADDADAAVDGGDSGDSDDAGVCSICLSADVEVALPCLHAFCSACIEDWHTHDQSCPLCRMKVDVNGAAGDVWMMDGGSEAELVELLGSISQFPHNFLQDKPDSLY